MMIKTLQWTPGVKRLSKSEYTNTGFPNTHIPVYLYAYTVSIKIQQTLSFPEEYVVCLFLMKHSC